MARGWGVEDGELGEALIRSQHIENEFHFQLSSRRGFRGKLAGRESPMIVLARALTYSTLFIGLLLVFLPARVLSWSGVTRPATIGPAQVAGMVAGAAGAALAVACILTFAFAGKGTPAPFDPPRRLVAQGPYRFVRNPMYIGAGIALTGAALFYRSLPLLAYAGLFLLVTHIFVVIYEEPTLRRSFGEDYDAYCRRVGRWWPRFAS
jgi:protein-S-isoprenylcysteine O-methyltransferase Ste14